MLTTKKKTMALLKKLLIERNMSQQDLARELKRDKTTISRWTNDSREINWENAEKIAEVLKVHPVEIYQPTKTIKLRWYVDADFSIKELEIAEDVRIPYEYYHSDIRAVLINIPGSWIDGEIHLFDISKQKSFSSLAINKACYVTPTKKYKKANPDCTSVYAVVRTNPDFSLCLLNPLSQKPVSPSCEKVDPSNIEIAAPVKCKFNPIMLGKKV